MLPLFLALEVLAAQTPSLECGRDIGDRVARLELLEERGDDDERVRLYAPAGSRAYGHPVSRVRYHAYEDRGYLWEAVTMTFEVTPQALTAAVLRHHRRAECDSPSLSAATGLVCVVHEGLLDVIVDDPPRLIVDGVPRPQNGAVLECRQ